MVYSSKKNVSDFYLGNCDYPAVLSMIKSLRESNSANPFKYSKFVIASLYPPGIINNNNTTT